MGKKKIAFFGIKYYPSRGGTSRVAEALIRELRKDYDITIYCYSSTEAVNHLDGVKPVMFSTPMLKDLGVFFFFFKCFLHLMFRSNYELVHIHKTEAAVFAPLIRLRYPVVATSHELPYLREKWSWFARLYLRFAEKIFIHSGALLTTISQSDAQYYREKYRKEVHFIPNGVVKPETATESQFDTFFREHGIDKRSSYLLFAARRIIPSKGCHHLLSALKNLNYQGSLIVCGDLNQMPEYSKTLRQMSQKLDVTFTGYVSSSKLLNTLIKRAELFVFPSELEGMSMMLLEVVSMETGVLASDIPQNTLIFDEEHISFFKSGHPEDLAKKLNLLLENPDQVKKKAKLAKAFARERYGMQSIAGQYAGLYAKAMNPKSGRT